MILEFQETELSRHPHKSPPQLSLQNRCNFFAFHRRTETSARRAQIKIHAHEEERENQFFFLRSSPHT